MSTEVITQNIERRQQLRSLEQQILSHTQLEFQYKHTFSNGTYAREVFIPKGSLVIGHIHKYGNITILSQGDLSVFTEEGTARFVAPFTWVAKAGVKHAVYANEDTTLITIHPVNTTNIDDIEKDLIAITYNDVPLMNNIEVKGIAV